MKDFPTPSVLFLVVVAVVGLIHGLALEGESKPLRDALPRSEKLELQDVAPVMTALPQVGWALSRPGAGWGEVSVPTPPESTPESVARGRELAQALCVACHGDDGRGEGELASVLPRAPRDLTGLLRTRRSRGPAGADEVFRTITAGAEHYGMPSFGHRPTGERWALAHWVLSLRKETGATTALELPPRPVGEPDLHLGQDVFRAHCTACHGDSGDGKGPVAAAGLVDAAGAPCPPTDFTRGSEAFRGGARPEDIAYTIQHGRPGTSMVPIALPADQLWAAAAYVSRLSEISYARRRLAWNEYFAAKGAPADVVPGAFVDDPPRRWSKRLSRRYAAAPEGESGCLACHEGIEPITDGTMATAISAVAGGDAARACAVCHEGRPDAALKIEAHADLVGNPGSLWVTSVGGGCAKCHSARGSLTTLMGEPLPEAVGGRLLHARSRATDPTGATSGNYTYRMQRGLMAQETGKVLLVTSSVGFVDPSEPKYSDFPLTDPDGPVPCVGSDDYRAWMKHAMSEGYIQRLERTQGLPTFEEAVQLGGGNRALASVVDYSRKACFRCHLWGEGLGTVSEHRSSGCSACHLVYDDQGWSDSEDRTIPPRRSGHPVTHQLVTMPPDEQCGRCHTRNPLTEGTEPHQIAGMGCVDCHTSIDLHGDGNAYPHMEHQVEVRCEDCHGTAESHPWDLPLGHSTPVPGTGPRGLHAQDGKQHLLTNRGNPRRNWLREGERVVIESFLTGKRHVTPQLRTPERPPEDRCSKDVTGHEEISCSLCHNRKAARCTSCHMTYLPYEPDRDWLLSARFYDPVSARQQNVQTPGKVEFVDGNTGATSVPFGAPDTRRDRANRLVPREPGCEVRADYMSPDGKIETFIPRFNPGSPSYPPVVANTQPHENAIPARACVDCHPSGVGPGKPLTLFGNVQGDRGDFWRPEPASAPSQAARRRWTGGK